jgi:hypothetical protein
VSFTIAGQPRANRRADLGGGTYTHRHAFAAAVAAVARFNAAYPVGFEVESIGGGIVSHTLSRAWVDGNIAVVLVYGFSRPFAISDLSPRASNEPATEGGPC